MDLIIKVFKKWKTNQNSLLILHDMPVQTQQWKSTSHSDSSLSAMNELLCVNILPNLPANQLNNSQHTLNSPLENECKGNINTARNWKPI